jgi:putative ABC transport system ATP-binding protein
MNTDVIITKNISKTYGKGDIKVHALRHTNINIKRGDYIAIIGPSGSGKSTFMNLIGCLDKPSSGKLFIDGTDVSQLNENQLATIRREKIGFIFQKYNLIPLSMSFAGVKNKDRLKRAEKLLGMVDLSKRMLHLLR